MEPILILPSKDQDIAELRQKLIEFNDAAVGDAQYTPFALEMRGPDGELLAGLAGQMYYGWLFVELLWVAEEARGQGLGKSLLLRAEREALHRGFHSVWLDTFSFQARGFYQKLGYEVFGTLDDMPAGHSRYFLWKSLKTSSAR